MSSNKLTDKQLAQYITIVDEIENLRTLTDREKEKLIRDIMEKPFLDLLCDVAFKYVFQQDMDSLKMLLNDILPEHIESVTTDPNELVSQVVEDKKPVLDILAKTDDGRRIIIEMQQERRKAFFPRLYYYGSKLVAGQLKKGQHYQNLLPVIVICFTNFTTRHKGCPKDQLVYEYEHREKTGGASFTGKSLHTTYICELPRLAQKALKDMNPVESWFYILRNCGKFASVPEGIDARYGHIIEAAKTDLIPDKERTQYLRAMLSDYDKNDIAEAYYEHGFEEGIEKGIEKGRKEVALTMLAKGVAPELVAEYTGYTKEELKA